MFDPITTPWLHEASRTRRIYDNPPTVIDAPYWRRTKALVARLSPVARPEPARAPQPVCGAQGR
jgi:hypothetical protein